MKFVFFISFLRLSALINTFGFTWANYLTFPDAIFHTGPDGWFEGLIIPTRAQDVS